MVYAYGVSLPGTYHIKNDIVCQDSHRIIRIGREVGIAAVADGLGSADHSDVGSKIAASISTEYCRQHLVGANRKTQVLDIIRASFTVAHRAIEMEANKNDRPVDLYDTTLTLAVLIRDTLFYGHSGDSGMIALTTQGRYEQVTEQQRDQEGRVFPLFFSDRWEFFQYEHKVASVLLATDGMLETFFPIYIKNDPVKIHVSLAQFFMDYRSLRINKLGEEAVQAHMKEFMEKIPDEQVDDDKTIVVLVNSSVRTKRQPDEYYEEPNWNELKRKHDEAWKREAYPGLYKSQNPTQEHEESPQFGQSVTHVPNTQGFAVPITRNMPVSKLLRKYSVPRILMSALVVVLGIGAGALLFFNIFDGGNVLHGHATFKWYNGDEYIGHWHNGTRHGQGRYIWAIGNVFTGYWNDGQRIEGTVIWPDGSSFKGSWADDRPYHGTFTSPDGIARTGAVAITETNSGWSWHIP